MKIMLILFCSLLVFTPFSSAQAENVRVLIEYRYGNQITNSDLVVLSNGLVIYKRRIQAHYEYLPSRQLAEKELNELISAIDSAAKTSSVYSEGEPTSFGSSSGALIGYTSSGEGATIFASSLSESSLKIKLVYQIGSDSDKVRLLVQGLVSEKMPLELIESNK